MAVSIFTTDYYLYTAGEPTLSPGLLNRVFRDIYSYVRLDSDNSYWGASPAVMYGADRSDESLPGWPNFVGMNTVNIKASVDRDLYTEPCDHEAGMEYGIYDGGSYSKIADIMPIGSTDSIGTQYYDIPLSTTDFGPNFENLHKLRIVINTSDGTQGRMFLTIYGLSLECTSDNFVKVYPIGVHDYLPEFTDDANAYDKDILTHAAASEMATWFGNSSHTYYSLMFGGTSPARADTAWEPFPDNIHGFPRVHITYDKTVHSHDNQYAFALGYVNTDDTYYHTYSYQRVYGDDATAKDTFTLDVRAASYSKGFENLRVLIAGDLDVPGTGAEFQVFDVYMEVFAEGPPPPVDVIIPVNLLTATPSTEPFTIIKQPDFVDTADFNLPMSDHIWHALNEPVDILKAYDWLHTGGSSQPSTGTYVDIDSTLISDWGTTEILCTFGADSAIGTTHPSWPNFTRSETVDLTVRYSREGSGDYQIGIEYGTIDGGGIWTYLGDVLAVGSSNVSTVTAVIPLDRNDFGGYEFPKLHELRIRLKTVAGSSSGVYLRLSEAYVNVVTDEFTRAKPTGVYDAGSVWTNVANILDGDVNTYAFATNLSTYTDWLQTTYSLMIGATGPLVADSAWETFPSVYFARVGRFYIASSTYDGDDIHALRTARVAVDNEIQSDSNWLTAATGFASHYRPHEYFPTFVDTDFTQARLLLDGDISKGSDGKELRIHYFHFDFYVEGDPPVIEDPVTTVPLGYLTGAVSAESNSLSVGGVSISPALQNVILGVESGVVSVGDVVVPVSTVSVLSSILNIVVDDTGAVNLEIPLNLLTTTSSSASLSVAPGAVSVSAMILNALATHGDSSVTIGDVSIAILSAGANIDVSDISFQGSVTVSVDSHALNVSIEDMAVSTGEAQVALVTADTQATAANTNIYATTTVSLIDLDMSLEVTKSGVAVGVAEIQLPVRTASVESVDFLLGLSIPLSIPVASATAAGLSLSTGYVKSKQKPLGIISILPSLSAESDLQMGYLKLARCYSAPAKITVNNPKRKVKFVFERDMEQVATERSVIDPIVASEKRTKVESQERVVLFKRKREK